MDGTKWRWQGWNGVKWQGVQRVVVQVLNSVVEASMKQSGVDKDETWGLELEWNSVVGQRWNRVVGND